MRTFATALVASVLVAACTVPGDPSATPAPATAMPTGAPPTATPVPATPAPTDTAMLIPATVTFDGTTCTYLGPTVVPLGSVIAWTFETTTATADQRASWELISFDAKHGVTWEEIVAWAAENTLPREGPAGSLPPGRSTAGEGRSRRRSGASRCGHGSAAARSSSPAASAGLTPATRRRSSPPS